MVWSLSLWFQLMPCNIISNCFFLESAWFREQDCTGRLVIILIILITLITLIILIILTILMILMILITLIILLKTLLTRTWNSGGGLGRWRAVSAACSCWGPTLCPTKPPGMIPCIFVSFFVFLSFCFSFLILF